VSDESLSARDHALRVAVLDVIGKEISGAYKGARKDAEEAFGPLRADGQSQQKVMMPDGTEIGLISIKSGSKDINATEDALTGWLEEHNPEGLEDYLDPSAATNTELLDVVRAVFPELVRTRIRAEVRAALLKEIEETGGYLVDKDSGDKEQVAEVTDVKPTGAFSYRPAKNARDEVIAAWRRGELQGIALDALALPAGDGASGE
jgi:hypothetical protein